MRNGFFIYKFVTFFNLIVIICQIKSAFCRNLSLFLKKVWLSRKKAVILHRFSMASALKVSSKAGCPRIDANEKLYWSLKMKGDNYEKVFDES